MIDRSKLQTPAPPRGLIERERVHGLLRFASCRPVTVLQAAAGFGKTTAVLSWARNDRRPVAWLTLDRFDNDPRRLVTHLFAALEAAVPGLGREALHAAEGGSDPIETCMPLLSAGVREFRPQGMVSVLDDFHVLTEDVCQDLVRAYVRTVMPVMRVTLTSRTRPALRLRAGDSSVITAGELAFRADETELLLNGSYGLGLSRTQLRELESKVHGWPVGLSLLGATEGARQESGDRIPIEHQLVSLGRGALADYVIQEMLDHFEPEIREFLLRTSILDRLCPALCTAVLQDPDAARILEQVKATSYVFVELGDDDPWVSSHSLVRLVIEQKLLDRDRLLTAQLHRRAATWYAENEMPAEAINHAIAAGDGLFAAQMIAENATALMQQRQYSTLRRALDAAPSDRGELGPLLEALEIALTVWTDTGDHARARVRAAELVARHPERIDVRRICDNVLASGLSGDVGGALRNGSRALRRDQEDSVVGPQRAVQLGQTLWLDREFAAAKRLVDPYVSTTDPQMVGVYARAVRSLVYVAEGEVHLAEQMAREAMALVQQAGAETSVEFILLQGTMAEVLRAAGKLEEARSYTDRYLSAREMTRPGSISHALALTLDARLALAERRRDRARASARRARGILGEYPDPGRLLLSWIEEVEQALQSRADETLPGTRPTPAESRVLLLLAERLSRGEIAARLYLSDATVKSHLRRIYRRLGVSNRDDAVRVANERGLL